jgi:hypothetical protein
MRTPSEIAESAISRLPLGIESLTGDLTPAEMAETLAGLRFTRADRFIRTVVLDRHARDFLVERLRAPWPRR